MGKTIPISYIARGEQTSPRWCYAFASGCGGQRNNQHQLQPGAVAMFGSPKLWAVLEQARRQGRTWYYGDHAYFGRGRYYRVTKNALQHDGTGNAGPDRFLRHGLGTRPWRRGGSHVLVCPPGDIYAILNGFNANLWRTTVEHKLRGFTDREIRFRSKPSQRHTGEPRRSMAEDLQDCWALVTYRSNAALDALRAGVPVFCTGTCASSRMGQEDLGLIEEPFYPDDREQFMWNLAANQWTLTEMMRGDCWDKIG